MGPPVSHEVSRASYYSGTPRLHLVVHTGLSPSIVSLPRLFKTTAWISHWCPQPHSEEWFGLIPISLAATDGIEVSLFSSGYLDVSVCQVRFHALYIQAWITPKCWVSPFRNPRIKARLPAPLGLSQVTTSFIAS